MAFAIIQTGGKQYKVAEGETVSIEKLPGKKEGDKVVFDRVLLLDDGTETRIGNPYLPKVKVEATISEEGKGKKIRVHKFKSKSRYTRRYGHRQPYQKVKVAAVK